MKHFRKYDKYRVYVRLTVRVQIKLTEMKQVFFKLDIFLSKFRQKNFEKKNSLNKISMDDMFHEWNERVCFQLRLARVIENVE